MHERARGVAREPRRRAQGARLAAGVAVGRRDRDVEGCRDADDRLHWPRAPPAGRACRAASRTPTGRARPRLEPALGPRSQSPCESHATTRRRTSPPAHRPIRSFVLRQGRMSPAQERALESLWPAFGVPYAPSPLDFDRVFGRRAPRVLDIGFGMGETTATMARRAARQRLPRHRRARARAWAACSNGSPTAASRTCA